MKISWLSIIGVGILLVACSTIVQPHAIDHSSSWSAADPLSIPLHVRHRQFEKGNLVVNPSFEEGRAVADAGETAFVLKGWETFGQPIRWIGPETPATDHPPPLHGTHCIEINRETASEVSPADGLISDYIPVIPGNYSFTYHIRLENIVSNRRRLGVRLFDAIAVKVLFFDANKQPVDAASINPVSGTSIDNSDKGYSFANFWRIDRFPWGKVNGRTYNYPYCEGDIPDQARYVRLSFGLKGTGTLWLDQVYFGYSKWNFTTLERFAPFFGNLPDWDQSLVPTPKHMQAGSEIAYYDPNDPASRLPIIVIPENPAPAERLAADMLQHKISQVLIKNGVPLAHGDSAVHILEGNYSHPDTHGFRLILSIGENKLYRDLAPQLPLSAIRNKPQGYIIKGETVGNCHVVFLLGETSISNYYASTTVIQLFADDRCIYHDATIVDFPDFLIRSYVFRNWKHESELNRDLAALPRMSGYKFNRVYYGYDRNNKTWYQPGDLYREGLRKAGRRMKQLGVMRLALMVNPYSHLDMGSPVAALASPLRNQWTHGDPQSLEKLMAVCKIGLEAGADAIMLLADDFLPFCGSNPQNYCLYSSEDQKRFVNLQHAHAFIINHLKKWLDEKYPGTRLMFCPPWYSNEHMDRSDGKAEVYLKELAFQIPPDVAIIWTGPTVRSLSIDMADLFRFSERIGRWPVLWNNTLYARNLEAKGYGGYPTHYPGKARLCNLFEPHDIEVPDQFYRFIDSRQIYTNGEAYSEIYKIKYATVADYTWNTTAYHPERSLWKVLCRTYGLTGAQQLIVFSDAYYQLQGLCSLMERQGRTDLRFETGKQALGRLNACLAKIADMLPEGHPLLSELTNLNQRQKRRLESICQ